MTLQAAPKRQLIPLLWIIFIDTLAWFIVMPVLVRIFIDGQGGIITHTMTDADRFLLFGIASMLAPAAFMLMAPVIGHFSDKYGRKVAFTFCLLAALIGFCLPIVGLAWQSMSFIFIGRFISGLSTASQPVAQAAIADLSQGKQKAFYLSLIACAMTLAMVLGPIIGGYASDPYRYFWTSLRAPFWIGVVLASINLILLWRWYHHREQVLCQEQAQSVWQHVRMLGQMVSRYKILGLIVLLFLMEIAWAQYYQAIYLVLLKQFHYHTAKISLFTGYIGLWMALGLTVVYSFLLRHADVMRIFYLSIVVAAVGLLGCTILSSVIFQWVFIVPVSICVGTAYPSLIAMMSNAAAKAHQGWVLGIAGTALAGAWMLTGFLSGVLSEYYLVMPLLFSAFSMLCTLALAPLVLRKMARNAEVLASS